MIKVDNTKRYNQLAIELLKRIFNGYYKLGARLPSTRELAKQASVNPNTMQRALQVLQDEKSVSELPPLKTGISTGIPRTA